MTADTSEVPAVLFVAGQGHPNPQPLGQTDGEDDTQKVEDQQPVGVPSFQEVLDSVNCCRGVVSGPRQSPSLLPLARLHWWIARPRLDVNLILRPADDTRDYLRRK